MYTQLTARQGLQYQNVCGKKTQPKMLLCHTRPCTQPMIRTRNYMEQSQIYTITSGRWVGIVFGSLTYPVRTPRIRFKTRNEPMIRSDTKRVQGQAEPLESLTYIDKHGSKKQIYICFI